MILRRIFHKRSKSLILVLWASLLLPQLPAYGDEFFNKRTNTGFYKWVDEKGITHYSAQPPTDKEIKADRIETSRGEAPSSEALKSQEERRQSLREAADQRNEKKMKQAEQVSAAEQKEQNKKNCDQAASNMKTLLENARVRETRQDGEVSYLSEEERQDRIKQNRDYVDTYCKDS